MSTRRVPLADLRDNPSRDRLVRDDGWSWAGLLRSVRDVGILAPIVVNRELAILDGHLRAAVARRLGRKTVEAVIVELRDSAAELDLMARLNGARVRPPLRLVGGWT